MSDDKGGCTVYEFGHVLDGREEEEEQEEEEEGGVVEDVGVGGAGVKGGGLRGGGGGGGGGGGRKTAVNESETDKFDKNKNDRLNLVKTKSRLSVDEIGGLNRSSTLLLQLAIPAVKSVSVSILI